MNTHPHTKLRSIRELPRRQRPLTRRRGTYRVLRSTERDEERIPLRPELEAIMNLGLRDAVTLGDALSAALREGREDKLDEYAAGSRAEALHVVALAHRLTRLATAPSAVRPLRNLALRLLSLVPAFRRGLAEQLSAIGHR